MDDFASAEQALVHTQLVVQAIDAEELHRPTPCPDWDVEALADHLVDTIARLGAAVGLEAVRPPSGPIGGRIQQVTQPILMQWRHRGLSCDVEFSGRTLPARLALGILCLELVVHGWDFAVALERPYDVPDAVAAHVFHLAQQTLTAESRAVAGFDPPVPVSADTGPLDHLVAFTGRKPVRMRR